MTLLRKQMLLCSILFLVFTLSACSAIGQTDENNLTDSATSAEKRYQLYEGQLLQPFQRKRLLFRQYRLLFPHPKMAYLIQR